MCSSSSYAGVGGCGLVVEGIALGSGGQFTPRLTMKRVYDTKCFRPERYRHEVANHYRDYKLQQHLQQHQHPFGQRHRGHRRRRRHRQFLGGAAEATSRVSASLASQYAQFRDVWPTHQHYFPRSNDTTSDIRGRRSVCSGGPPDDTYNDAVRRIRSAHSCEQLRQLVQRQLERHRLPWRRSSNDEALAPEALGGSQSSDRFDYKLNIHKRSAESPQRRQQGEEQVQQRQRVDLYAYLQLASGYYERGLQADLKYLQSIGQQQQQQQQQRQHRRHHRNAIKPGPPGQYLDDSESPVQRLTGRLVTLLKSLRRKAADQGEPRRAGHPEIRVNIRSVKQEQPETDEEEQEEAEEEQQQQQQQQEGSMCDYYAQGFSTTTAAAATTEARASIATADQRRLYEIIDNLSHLSIAGDSGGGGGGGQLTLPQITLTDYSTAQQVALYGNSIVTLQMIPNEARPAPSRDLRAT